MTKSNISIELKLELSDAAKAAMESVRRFTQFLEENGGSALTAKSVPEAKAKFDRTVRVLMKVITPGIASFHDPSINAFEPEIQEILLRTDDGPGKGYVKNGAFRGMELGSEVIVTFRISLSSSRRTLISVSPSKPESVKEPIISFDADDTGELERAVTGDFSAGRVTPKLKIDLGTGTLDKRKLVETENYVPPILGVDEPDPVPFSKPFLSQFYVSDEAMRVFCGVQTLSKHDSEKAVTVLITGPSGYGKTSLAEGYARSNDMKYLRFNCASVRDPEEWFGYREAREGSTVFVPSELVNAIREGNYVICFDEYNRIEPDIHNTLLPLLDHDGRTSVHGEEVAVGKKIIFIATINLGHQYTGTYQLDEAITNRFLFFLEVAPLPANEEAKVLKERYGLSLAVATKIVALCNKIRSSIPQLHCSVRTSLSIARQMAAGISFRDAVLNCLQYRASDGSSGSSNIRKELIDLLNVS